MFWPIFWCCCFFVVKKKEKYTENNSTNRSIQNTAPHLSKKRSARFWTQPSVSDHTSLRPATSSERTATRDGQHCIHRRCQAKCVARRNTGGESRAFAAANASSLREPASSLTPMTTRRQRSPSNNSQYFASLRCRLRSWLHRSGMAPRCQGRSQCDVSPWPGFNCLLVPRLHGNVHVRSFTSWRTVAPASRHTLANPFRWQRSLNVRIVMSHSVERGTALALSISISVRKSLGWTSNSHVSCTWTRMRARRTIGIVASRVATLLAH